MAVANRGRGLSQAVLQTPDIIGQGQRQQQINQRDRALDLQEQSLKAKQAPKPKTFKLDNGDIARFPNLYGNLGTLVNTSIAGIITENGSKLAEQSEIGYGSEINRMQNALNQSKSMSERLDSFEKKFDKDAEKTSGIDRQRYREYTQYKNEVISSYEPYIDATGSLNFKNANGDVITSDELIEELNPVNYYAKPITFTDGLSSKFNNTNLSRANLPERADSFIKNVVAYDNDLTADLIRLYFMEEEGYKSGAIPAGAAADIMQGKTVNGVNLDKILDFGIDYTVDYYEKDMPQRGGGGNDRDNRFTRVRPLSDYRELDKGEQGAPFNRVGAIIEDDRRAVIPVVVNGETLDGEVEAVYRMDDGTLGGVVRVRSTGKTLGEVDFDEDDINRIELELNEGETIDDLIQRANPNSRTQGRSTQPTAKQTEQTEELDFEWD